MSRAFLDTNILVYAVGQGPFATVAAELLETRPAISAQVLNELTNVLRSKLKFDWDRIYQTILDMRSTCSDVLPITSNTNESAIAIADRYQLHIYDASIIASALEAQCATLYSEDMQHGMVIDNRITIRNPFV